MKPEVANKFISYPESVRPKLMALRRLILETAREIKGLPEPEETLKWGEPSYHVKKGSPVRIDWKTKMPNQYAMYFNCSTSLVGTFRIIYGDKFRFEGNRAIIFDIEEEIPKTELKHCISLALTYHQIKHLPMLGV